MFGDKDLTKISNEVVDLVNLFDELSIEGQDEALRILLERVRNREG